ncbi:MAG TPA: type VI secretion system tip protein TssI/VgrG [Gammaproteobacteria bacterium]|nr:type VI secretion system tip protein TssI/VgrG [Gammaproteobacteria bacterium]
MANAQPVKIKTALADEDLLFRTMDGTEELGRPFLYDLELLSPKEDLALDDVLGQEACVTLDVRGGAKRYFHGYVTQFAQTGRRGRYATYRMQLRPWLWFLTRTADCRIFQGKTVPEIVTAVFREHGFSDFKDSLSGSYRTWEYCVQYRETDFNFVSRLMEQEGIYYYFLHEDGKHTLVLSDSHGAHSPLDNGYSEIPYYPPAQAVRDEHIYDWYFQKSVQPGKYVLRAYDFRKPKANLEVNSVVSRDHAQAEFEVFDYPGEYFERGEGDAYVKARIEELQTEHERARGVCDARGVCTGGLFKLAEYPRQDQNREYLIVSAHQSISLGDYESADQSMQFKCVFNAMDSAAPYRVARLTPKPVVQGPQTAITVGPAGEEIWTDKFGRIKVQFHWDRYGKADENSSCWVRVAQVWAGSNWGGMHIPRVGQEVIVDFIEGDPDRPIVTGRVYNADNMPPYGLPDNKTQSGIKSRSSKGGNGDNFNEIRFEDLKGSEQMYIHAEKDQSSVVENDQTEDVGRDKHVTVGRDRTEDIGQDRTLHVGRDKTENVDRDKSIQVGKDHSEGIKSNMTISVGNTLTETVAINYTETVGAAMELTVGGVFTESVGANKTQTVGGSKDVSVGKSYGTSVGKDMELEVAENLRQQVGKDYELRVAGDANQNVDKKLLAKAKSIQITADDDITLKTGSAEIVMKKNGDITIKGKKITVNGSGDVILKGSKIQAN